MEPETVAQRHHRERRQMHHRHQAERLAELGPDQTGGHGALDFPLPIRAILELEAARLEGMAAEIGRWMPGPLWELFDGAARELRDLLEDAA